MTHRAFQLVLFSTDCRLITAAVAGGVTSILIDWESAGKRIRQLGADTQVGTDTLEDLPRVRASVAARIVCRTDRYGSATHQQIEYAIEHGADEVLLPMVRGVAEVEAALDQVRRRIGVGILIETQAAVGAVADLARLPLSRIYVGLNDLAIERRSSNIFDALADGTVERIRRHCDGVPFGLGGLTLPDCGWPIPCRLLMAEMIRLGCDYSFLRRSFHRDMADVGAAAAVERILDGLRSVAQSDPAIPQLRRMKLLASIASWHVGSPGLGQGSSAPL